MLYSRRGAERHNSPSAAYSAAHPVGSKPDQTWRRAIGWIREQPLGGTVLPTLAGLLLVAVASGVLTLVIASPGGVRTLLTQSAAPSSAGAISVRNGVPTVQPAAVNRPTLAALPIDFSQPHDLPVASTAVQAEAHDSPVISTAARPDATAIAAPTLPIVADAAERRQAVLDVGQARREGASRQAQPAEPVIPPDDVAESPPALDLEAIEPTPEPAAAPEEPPTAVPAAPIRSQVQRAAPVS